MKKLAFLLTFLLAAQIYGCTNWQSPFINIAGTETDPNIDILYNFPAICATDSGYRMAIWERNVYDSGNPNNPPSL